MGGSSQVALCHAGVLEQAAVAQQGIQRHMFFVQDIQPDGQRGERRVNVGAHQVCQAEITFRPTQQHGAACIKVGHALAGVIVHGDHTAAVRCPLQRKVEQLGKQLTLVHFCTAESGVLGLASTQAFRSLVQLLQCTMATGSPAGVVTISISG